MTKTIKGLGMAIASLFEPKEVESDMEIYISKTVKDEDGNEWICDDLELAIQNIDYEFEGEGVIVYSFRAVPARNYLTSYCYNFEEDKDETKIIFRKGQLIDLTTYEVDFLKDKIEQKLLNWRKYDE